MPVLKSKELSIEIKGEMAGFNVDANRKYYYLFDNAKPATILITKKFTPVCSIIISVRIDGSMTFSVKYIDRGINNHYDRFIYSPLRKSYKDCGKVTNLDELLRLDLDYAIDLLNKGGSLDAAEI
jgi:hypothetical protein